MKASIQKKNIQFNNHKLEIQQNTTKQFTDNRPNAIAQRQIFAKDHTKPIIQKKVIQRISNKKQNELWGKWEDIELQLDYLYEENRTVTLPIASELEEIRDMMGKDSNDISNRDLKIIKQNMKTVKQWIRSSTDTKLDGITILHTSKRGTKNNPINLKQEKANILNDATNVCLIENGIQVYLDVDQLKHQPLKYPIGTRQTKSGNTFNPSNSGSSSWHISNTLKYMAGWAASLDLEEGKKQFHGQFKPVNGIHYEGYCILLGGTKYVLFHCYPANNSNLKY